MSGYDGEEGYIIQKNIMIDIRNTDEEKQIIKHLYNEIVNDNNIDHDLQNLLNDGVNALEQELYYASILVFTAFIEKFSRDVYIIYSLKLDENKGEEDYFEYLEKHEHSIEEGNRDFSFKQLCKKVMKIGLIDEKMTEELISFYEDVRIPAQHAIYGRLIRKYEIPHKVEMLEVNIGDIGTKDDFIKALGNGGQRKLVNNYNPIFRSMKMKEIFKIKSFEALHLIKSFVTTIDLGNKN